MIRGGVLNRFKLPQRLAMLAGWLWLGWLSIVLAAGQGIQFSTFAIRLKPQPLVENLQLKYELNDYLRDSLLNGMTLEQEIRFELEWHNTWWWNTSQHLVSVHSELKYQPLSKQYQVTRRDTQEQWGFSTLPAALQKLGSIKDYRLPPFPADAFNNNASVFVSAELKPQALRLPLRLQELFTDRYSLSSDGVLWPIP